MPTQSPCVCRIKLSATSLMVSRHYKHYKYRMTKRVADIEQIKILQRESIIFNFHIPKITFIYQVLLARWRTQPVEVHIDRMAGQLRPPYATTSSSVYRQTVYSRINPFTIFFDPLNNRMVGLRFHQTQS